MTEILDVAVIGGGVIGCAVAAKVAGPRRSVMLLEQQASLGTGVTSRNSGVIHSGLYYPPASLKAASCIRGNQLLYEWAAVHGVWHRKVGKLVVAQVDAQLDGLDKLEQNARASGAPGISRLTGDEATALEPSLRALSAIYCAETGIIDPHELVLSLRASAEAAGAVFVTNAAVSGIESAGGAFRIQTARGEVVAERVVNAAGLYSDHIARMVGLSRYTIHPCRGDYFRLQTTTQYHHLIYPMKDPGNPGLGIHLTLDRGGGYRLGPDAEYVSQRDDFRDADHKHDAFVAAATRLLGDLGGAKISYDGCGIRPKLRAPGEVDERDFVLCEEPSGFVHLIGIESPGLTACLDLGERAAALVS